MDMNTYPSPGSVPSSSKRKLESYISSSAHSASSASAYGSSFNSPSESHVFVGPSTDISNWNQTKEGKEVIQRWIQVDNTWTEKAIGWSQHEFEWYRRMSDLYQRWSADENSDKSVHPKELVWASMKLDQAKREAVHCREWIAYARWQVASRTGKGVGACPLLPSLEGRVPVENKGTPLSPADNDGGGDGGNSGKTARDEDRSAGFGPVQHPVQAVQDRQAPMKNFNQNAAQGAQEASETFVALVKSTSQSSTAVQTHFQTFTKAPQAPVQVFTQNTPQDINSKVSEEFAAFLQLQKTSQNHIAFQTPANGCFQASKEVVTQAPVRDIAPVNDSVNASHQFCNPPSGQNHSVPTGQARIKTSTRVFQAPGLVQAPIQAPFQSPQVSQPPRNPRNPWTPQGLVPSHQQVPSQQALEPMPLLTFAEFIATGSQQLTGQSVGQPTEVQQPSQQSAQRPTQKLNQSLNQSRIQKPATPKASPNTTPKVIQKVTKKATPQAAQRITQSPTQQPTQQQNQQPTPQPTRHDPIPDSCNGSGNTAAHGKAAPHNNIPNFGEPRESVLTPADGSNYLNPSLFYAADMPTGPPGPAGPSEPAGPPGPPGPAGLTGPGELEALPDSEVSKMVSDWWDKWIDCPPPVAPLDSGLGQDIGVLSGQAVSDLELYFDENIEVPVWDDF